MSVKASVIFVEFAKHSLGRASPDLLQVSPSGQAKQDRLFDWPLDGLYVDGGH